jgi:hypothetical protein
MRTPGRSCRRQGRRRALQPYRTHRHTVRDAILSKRSGGWSQRELRRAAVRLRERSLKGSTRRPELPFGQWSGHDSKHSPPRHRTLTASRRCSNPEQGREPYRCRRAWSQRSWACVCESQLLELFVDTPGPPSSPPDNPGSSRTGHKRWASPRHRPDRWQGRSANRRFDSEGKQWGEPVGRSVACVQAFASWIHRGFVLGEGLACRTRRFIARIGSAGCARPCSERTTGSFRRRV